MNIDLTEIICSVIVVLAGILMRYIVPMLASKLDMQKLQAVREWAKIGVQAADMIFSSTQGREKKQYVIDFLASKGYSVDTEKIRDTWSQAINDIIESEVMQLKIEKAPLQKES